MKTRTGKDSARSSLTRNAFDPGRSGNITFENNTVENCCARYAAFGDDVIRYEPVVPDKTSATPVHEKLILKNNRFLRDIDRNYTIALRYLGEAVMEGNTSNVKLEPLLLYTYSDS